MFRSVLVAIRMHSVRQAPLVLCQERVLMYYYYILLLYIQKIDCWTQRTLMQSPRYI